MAQGAYPGAKRIFTTSKNKSYFIDEKNKVSGPFADAEEPYMTICGKEAVFEAG
jgi:hypothetical protein